MSALALSLTGVWISSVSAILMYSAFSPQRISGKRFWLAFAVCTAARLPIAYAVTGISGIFRLAIGFAPLLLMHCLLYTGTPVLRLFVTVSFYSWSICMDNLVFTAAFTLIPEKTLLFSGSSLHFVPAILVHILILLLCIFVKKLHPYRPGNSVSTVGAAVSMGISLLSIAMTAVLGDGFQNQQISPALLLFCAVFSSCVNISTFCLISWLEQAAQLKQENLMLQVQMKAQKDSVEALGNYLELTPALHPPVCMETPAWGADRVELRRLYSLLERHPEGTATEAEILAFLKAEEAGERALETLCRTLCRDCAERLRNHAPLPGGLLPYAAGALMKEECLCC